MDLRRALGLALCAVALALVIWGLWTAKVIRIDLPPATPAARGQGLMSLAG